MPAPEPDIASDPLAVLHPRARPARRLGLGAAIVLVVVAVGASAWWSAASQGGGSRTVLASVAPSSTGVEVALAADPPVLVHVLGAVAEPGIVELAPGARIVDAIAAAGGLAPDADPAGVNLARPVADGEQVRVPFAGEVAPPAAGGPPRSASNGDGLVHLNTADLAALDTLPRIGPAIAQRILDYREANGPFGSIDELGEVAGIGDAILAGLDGLVAL